jgi:ubiquitin carboxyl-terminal hydrolase 25/28
LPLIIFSHSLFYGKTISYITAEKGTRSKEELWSDIKVDVATGSRDIYAAIDGAFDVQKVFVDGETAEQYGSISKLPPVLQIQVQRVQFDPVKKASFKSTHHLELKEIIYLDRYMDSQKSELMNRRRECWAWKDKLRELEARKSELLRSSVCCVFFDIFGGDANEDHRKGMVKTCPAFLTTLKMSWKIWLP